MKHSKIVLAGFCLLFSASSQAAVIISSTVGNGGFVNASSGISVSSLSGWQAVTNTVFVSGSSSGLTSTPFGVDTAVNSRVIVLGHDGGTDFRSTTGFTVGAGETINLSMDLWRSGGGSDANLTISLYDTVNNTTFHTFSTSFNTATLTDTAVQKNLSTGVLASAGSNLVLRFQQSANFRDFRMDRIHLESIPEPSSLLLGALGVLGLLRRRR